MHQGGVGLHQGQPDHLAAPLSGQGEEGAVPRPLLPEGPLDAPDGGSAPRTARASAGSSGRTVSMVTPSLVWTNGMGPEVEVSTTMNLAKCPGPTPAKVRHAYRRLPALRGPVV